MKGSRVRGKNRKTTRNNKRSGSILSWLRWNCLSAGYGERQFDPAHSIYYYDWRTGSYKPVIPYSWLAYHYTAFVVSGWAFFYGIGQVLNMWMR